MRTMINSRWVDVPTDSDGSIDAGTFRRAANVPEDRPLVVQSMDGANRVINPGEKMKIRPDQHYMDLANHTRGGCTS